MSINEIKVSIIIPVFKTEEYLEQCIESVLVQSYNNIEIILVDDGSPDKCPQICDSYQMKDARIKVIHKDNRGSSDARKMGLVNSTGDFICFLDSDDWISDNTIEICVNEIIKHAPVDGVFFTYVREYPKGAFPSHIWDESRVFSGKEVDERIHRRLFGLVGNELKNPERLENLGSCCMKLYSRQRAENGRFFDTSEVGSSEDTLFNIYALHGCNRIVYIDQPFYHYRKAGESLSSSYRPDLAKQWNRLFDIMNEVIQNKNLTDDYREALNNRIGLSILGIGMNEIASCDGFFKIRKKIKQYLETERYHGAVADMTIDKLPIPWKALILFSKRKRATLVWLELKTIECIKKMRS